LRPRVADSIVSALPGRLSLAAVTGDTRWNELEVEIKQLHPEVGWCFVEPDVTD